MDNGFFAWVKEHMLLVVGMLLVAGLLLVKRQTNTASTSTNTADLSGLQKTANGLPIVYRDVSDTFLNYSLVQGSYNTSNPVTTTTTTTSSVVNNPTQPVASAPPPPPTNIPTVEHPIEHQTYTVVSGDTLSAIAARYGTNWQALYNQNKDTVDALSHQHGNPIPGGEWNNIFPGEVLNIT